jgi:hypothetical protein
MGPCPGSAWRRPYLLFLAQAGCIAFFGATLCALHVADLDVETAVLPGTAVFSANTGAQSAPNDAIVINSDNDLLFMIFSPYLI